MIEGSKEIFPKGIKVGEPSKKWKMNGRRRWNFFLYFYWDGFFYFYLFFSPISYRRMKWSKSSANIVAFKIDEVIDKGNGHIFVYISIDNLQLWSFYELPERIFQ